MDKLEMTEKKIEALELMLKRGFQNSTIVQILEEPDAVLYVWEKPNCLEAIALSIAQAE